MKLKNMNITTQLRLGLGVILAFVVALGVTCVRSRMSGQ